MSLPVARARERGIATGELGITSVIVFIIAVLVIRSCSKRSEPALECVTTAARIGEGAAPPDPRCPVSGKPFTSLPVCPDPDRHLRWSPRFDRDGSRQELPAPPQAAALEIGRTASYIAARQNGATVMVDVKPRIWWRYLVGPLLHLVCIVYIIAFFVQFGPKERSSMGIIAVSLVAALGGVWCLWVTVPRAEGSQAFQFDPATGRVTRHRYLFGRELAPEVYDARGVAFIRSETRPTRYSLVLAVRGSRAVELIDGLGEDDAILGSWLRTRFPK